MGQKLNPLNGLAWNLAQLSGKEGVAGTALTAKQGVACPQFVEIPLSALSVTMTDATTNGSHGSKKVFTFPEGNVVVLGAVTNLDIARVGTAIAANAAVVGSLGSVAVANTDATLTSTEANIMPSTSATLTSGAGTCDGQSTAISVLDGTATPVDVYLNFAIPDAGSSGNDALTVTGSIFITYLNLGDN